MEADLNYSADDPHVVHVPSGVKCPIKWINGCPHILLSHRDELEFTAKLHQTPQPDGSPVNAMKIVTTHRKRWEPPTEHLKKLPDDKHKQYEL